jgi:hypothetical protein
MNKTFAGIFRALPRSQFVVLQSAIFPTALPVVFVLSWEDNDFWRGPIQHHYISCRRKSTINITTTNNYIHFQAHQPVTLSPSTAKTIQERYQGLPSLGIDDKKGLTTFLIPTVIRLNKKFRKLHGYPPIVNLVALWRRIL